MMLCFLAVVVLGYSALGFIHQFALAVCALFAIGYSIQLSNIPIFTYIQKTTEARMLGKVTAIMTSVSTALTPLSLAIMSYLLHLGVELQSVVRVYGICLILITAGAFCITRPFLCRAALGDIAGLCSSGSYAAPSAGT